LPVFLPVTGRLLSVILPLSTIILPVFAVSSVTSLSSALHLFGCILAAGLTRCASLKAPATGRTATRITTCARRTIGTKRAATGRATPGDATATAASASPLRLNLRCDKDAYAQQRHPYGAVSPCFCSHGFAPCSFMPAYASLTLSINVFGKLFDMSSAIAGALFY
jgi:hypothetical protein